MRPVVRGRLLPPSGAPAVGERTEAIAKLGDVLMEQILSGAIGHEPLQLVRVTGRSCRADQAHLLLKTELGTSWLALRAAPHDPPVEKAPKGGGGCAADPVT